MTQYLTRLSVTFACLLIPGLSAHAATLAVAVRDTAGRPLADAVVLLEPATGKLPVKPLPPVEVSQVKRQFDPLVTVITVGTPVNFPNFDTVRHHVYSFSPIKTFELKLYAGVPGAPVVFDKPGVAVLGCNIHDRMTAWVVVADTPYYARTGGSGDVHLDNVPPGAWRLRAWHPGLAEGAAPAPVAVTLTAADARERITLPVTAP